MTIWTIIDKYGLPLAFLAMVLFVLVKWIAPFMVTQLREANTRNIEIAKMFTDSLKTRDERTEKMFDKIAERLDKHDEKADAREARRKR